MVGIHRKKPQRVNVLGVLIGGLLLPALLASGHAQAQTPPPSTVSPSIDNFKSLAKPPELPPPTSSRPEAPPIAAPQKPAPGAPAGAEKVHVPIQEIKIEGSTVYKDGELEEYTRDLIGKTLPVSAVFDAATLITARYRDDGYILSQALVPEQRVGDGKFTIRIVEGYVSEVVVQGDVGPVRSLIQRMVDHIPQSRPANSRDIERYLLLARDIPGIALSGIFRVAPGASGARQLVVQVVRKEISGNASYDNRGSRYLGPGQATGEVNLNSYNYWGDKLDLVYFNTLSVLRANHVFGIDSGGEQQYGQATYTGYIGSRGWQYKIFVGAGPANPGFEFAKSQFHSDTENAGGSILYPVVRSRNFDLNLSAQFDITNSTIRSGDRLSDKAEENQKLSGVTRLRVFRWFASGNARDEWGGQNTYNIGMHRGVKIWGALRSSSSLEDLKLKDIPRSGGKSDFTKLTVDADRVQHLFEIEDGTAELKLAVTGQYSNDILYPNEQFRLGGYDFGRGYFSGRLLGDHGVGGEMELRYNSATGLPFISDSDYVPQYFIFLDMGRVWSKIASDNVVQPGGAGVGPFSLASAGVGVRLTAWEWMHAEIELDRPLTIPTYNETRNPAFPDPQPKPPLEFFTRLIATF
jgi:hemolysin activation/secretion protein